VVVCARMLSCKSYIHRHILKDRIEVVICDIASLSFQSFGVSRVPGLTNEMTTIVLSE